MSFTLLIQLATITVGDTAWLSMAVPVPNGHVLRPQVWDLGEIGVVLAPPDVSYQAGVATVRYPVTFWFPGEHHLTMPGAILVSTAGKSDTLGGLRRDVSVRSVLPDSQPKAAIPPRPAAALVTQSSRSVLPVMLLLALVGAGSAAAARRRWRRVGAVASIDRADHGSLAPEAVLDRWRGAGEHRSALDGWAHLIEDAKTRRPGMDHGGGSELAAELTEASFRHGREPEQADELVTAARRWLAERS